MPNKGYKHSAESKAKMSAWQKGKKKKPLTEEHKRNIGKAGKGRVVSEETRKRMSIASSSRTYRPLTEEHKKNIGKAHKGRVKSDEERKHISEALMGHKLSDETKAKISAAHAGKVLTDEHKQHLSEAGIGRIVSEETRKKLSNRKHSTETRAKMSVLATGENSSQWQGGVSFEPYPPEFNEPLKRQIRERDNYTCQLCSKTKEEEDKKLAVHHIDYDKNNCNEKNLTTLCGSCNIKVNTNREEWTEYFQSIMLCIVN